MKKSQGFMMGKQGFVAALVLGVLLLTNSALADTRTWTGGGGDDYTLTALNWDAALVSGDRMVFAVSTKLTPNYNHVSPFSIGGIRFDAAASAFTVGGGQIRMSDAGIDFSGNPSTPITQTINNSFLLVAGISGNTLTVTTQTKGAITLGGAVNDGGNNRGITKAGDGILTLNGASNFTGQMRINAGVVNANTIANVGTVSSLGSSDKTVAAGVIRIGNTTTSGTLVFTGTSSVGITDRQVQIGNGTASGDTGGAIIANNKTSATDTLTFSNAIFNAANTTATAERTLTLGGSNTGLNTISGVIVDNAAAAKINLTKTGAGTWVLSGANTYSGTTAVGGGTLLVNNATGSGTGSGSVTVTNATLGGVGTLGGAVTLQADSRLAPGTNTVVGGILTCAGGLTLAAGVTHAFDCTASTNDSVAVVGALTLQGANTVELTLSGEAMPEQVTLFTFDSVTGDEHLASWTVTGVPPNYRVLKVGNRIVVQHIRKGTQMSVL